MLHEALDILHAGMLGVSEAHRDLALDVEGEALFRPSGDEMQVAAHRPQEILAAPEQLQFVLIEHMMIDQFLEIAALPPIAPSQAATNGHPESGVPKRSRPTEGRGARTTT